MPQTFYIESDEEIISVIGRLHKTDSNEILFVFPKRALVLQSIINLRLLSREAEKCGKEIVIVSQDEVGRMLAEKAGIPTENYSEDIMQRATHLELSSEMSPVSPQNIREEASEIETDSVTPSSAVLGTSDFFGSQKNIDSFERQRPTSIPVPTEKPESLSLRIRNASPEKLTALNSKRFDTGKVAIAPKAVPQTKPPLQVVPPLKPVYENIPQEQSVLPRQESTTNERLKNFYAQKTNVFPQAPLSQIPQKRVMSEAPQSTSVDKKARIVFIILGFISLLSLASVGAFFFLPKAEITLTPYLVKQTFDKEFSGKIDGQVTDENIFATRIVEKDKEVSVMVSATGKSEGSGQKAHGTVQIINNYSADTQSLIATTRLETSDGKLFRLETGVVVPGMKTVDGKTEAGTVEAQIIADQVGEEYNIKEPASFSISGFKGGEKYTKFTVQSTKPITGGGVGTLSDMNVVEKVDLDTALTNAKEKAKEMFLTDIRNDMLKNEALLDDQIEVTPIDIPVLPALGSVSSTFEYKGLFKVKALIFDEQKIEDIITNENEKRANNIPLRVVSLFPSYTGSLVDFSLNTFRIKVQTVLDMESYIDKEKVRISLLGKKEADLESILKNFPEIKNFKLNFSVGGLLHTIPNDPDRVSIIVLPGESGL
ncbi:MAG: hypothetical protein GW815_00350 [Candidatus Moranbacteria bacterium]|nr:hypothetical protein [Candidatus Moranbacteria bacterium]OIQ01640.1 MAG: hypothetical protein AUK58_04335 [Candidatus Moranbacteria bacterium CG2_30_41_165]PIP25835.1 MAG: hypothetical protein COX32_01285 [Candidatus Moranbacteria bacterium CG23_combo_of_CG06-09_8_20_14_all_41_28]PIV85874.1 MAG: hypothetical protein COW50_04650 [Candidatus Moranbacteria bacterium CG17_big_fil_post_rev_8_21_14_2_50_41_107]PIW93893.1 MAG: hypothetical protein COZ86_04030 [Candidatus Moranbacteria bacterium CG_